MARRPSALIWLTAGLVLLLALTAAGGQGGAGQPTARFVLSSGGYPGKYETGPAGFFLIRDSVDHLAGVLEVTRYTIYNYLNENRAS